LSISYKILFHHKLENSLLKNTHKKREDEGLYYRKQACLGLRTPYVKPAKLVLFFQNPVRLKPSFSAFCLLHSVLRKLALFFRFLLATETRENGELGLFFQNSLRSFRISRQRPALLSFFHLPFKICSRNNDVFSVLQARENWKFLPDN
jgi:hypothetical protein